MDALRTLRAAERARDLKRVVRLWRTLGHSSRSIQTYCWYLRRILESAHGCDYSQLCADRVVQWSQRYARQHQCSPHNARQMWLSVFRAWAWGLKQLGISVGSIALSKPSQPPPEAILRAFIDYGKQLGWGEKTLRAHRLHLKHLRGFLLRHHRSWPIPELKDLDHFLMFAAKQWLPASVDSAARACRAWMRFLYVTGRSKHDLAASVTLAPRISYPRPARALPWSTVRQLHRGIDTTTSIGRRDDAQYTLFCAYGLSSAEVTYLKLDDIDWDAGILHIRRRKNGATVDLPLLPAVTRAIALYLRRARPESTSRYVFIRHTIPFGPLSSSTVAARVHCWAERAGVHAPFLGTHLFRHSFATKQLERGIPLKVIADILGHRDCRTTGVYVRTALERLRPLALPVPL
jgi:integrase/recombinase XerD